MTFEELLNQTIAMLQRQGRVSYRALKRQFQLDDDCLEDLKLEIIEIHRVAVDHEHRMFVWTGPPAAPPSFSPASGSSQRLSGRVVTPPLPLPDDRPPVSPTLEGERRQVTILFADISGFTALAERLDPEAVRDMMNACFAHLVPLVDAYGGTVDKFIGDEIMALFGAPVAHEKGAERAVRAALGMMEALTGFNADHGTDLGLHCGINTGLVIAGGIGTEARQDYSVMGDAVNLAARLEDASERGQIFVGPETYRLTQAVFTFNRLEPMVLKGKTEPVPVYCVLGFQDLAGRPPEFGPPMLPPLVGREAELAVLRERWDLVRHGRGQVVLLNGEAGIGKSRLIQALKAHLAQESHTRFELQGTPYYTNSAFHPVIELLQRLLHWHHEDPPAAKLQKLEHMLSRYHLASAETVPLLAALLAVPLPRDRYPALDLTPQRQRQKTLETLLAVVLKVAERQPVLLIVEDVHWVDASFLELLELVIMHTPTASLYVVLTYRPAFVPPWKPGTHVIPLVLGRLPRVQAESIITQMAGGKTLPAEVVEHLVVKTDGVPLFVEELTKAVLESGVLRETAESYKLTAPLSSLVIPASLQDTLMARLDRLSAVKSIAQLAATVGVGRQFSYEVLQAVAPLDEPALQQGLAQLVAAEIVYQQGLPPQATYQFKHALIQDAAYHSLLKSTRERFHQQIAQMLEARFPEIAAAQPELLAHHYTGASLHVQAIEYWQRAGQRAIESSAYVEALAHLRTGLELVGAQPDTPARIQQELPLQATLGLALMVSKGFAATETGAAYRRAHDLCQQVGETPLLFPALRGLYTFYQMRGECRSARDLAEQFLRLARTTRDDALLLVGHRDLGTSLYELGEFTLARRHLEHALALDDTQPQRPQGLLSAASSGVTCRAHAARVWWCLGWPEQALQWSRGACALAQDLAHGHSQVLALTYAALVHHLRREVQATQACAETMIALATAQGLPLYVAPGLLLRGWALATQGQPEAGLALLHQALDHWLSTGARLNHPLFLALLAQAHGCVDQPAVGLRLLADALETIRTTAEREFEAEVYRLKGVLLLQVQGQSGASGVQRPEADQLLTSEAEACFQQALAVARRQQAKSWELRAATSLAQLWRQQGQHATARHLLEDVYGWFTEGFDTADLQEAQALLDALS